MQLNKGSYLVNQDQSVPLSAYIELTKPRIALMVVVTAAIGYFLSMTHYASFGNMQQFLIAMLGVALAGGGASVLNQYLEQDVDAKMERTKNRPIPAGIVSPSGQSSVCKRTDGSKS